MGANNDIPPPEITPILHTVEDEPSGAATNVATTAHWPIFLCFGSNTALVPSIEAAIDCLARNDGIASPAEWMIRFRRLLAREFPALVPLPDDPRQLFALAFARGILRGGYRH